jgi:hypothetical protein
MAGKITTVAVLIIAGAIVADLVSNYQGTKVLVNGIIGLWGNSLNAVNPGSVSKPATLA